MTAQQLKNAILQEAIEGRLVPQDPNDEPASILLERIHKEKEILAKEGKLKKKDLEVKPISEDEIPFEIPESWEWCKLGTIVTLIGGFAFKSHEYTSAGSRVIRISDITENGFINKNVVRYPFNDKLSQYVILEGDILMAMTGGTVGKSLYVKYLPEETMLLNQRVAIIRVNTVLTDYIDYVIKSQHIQSIITEAKNSTNDNISMGDIFNFPIPLPPIAEQRRIVAKIEELLPKVEEYGKAQDELNKLNEELPERLKKSILQEAIEGRLVSQDPNDEPASVLLAKIRKEKEQLVKASKLKKKDLEETPISEDEKPFEIPESWEWCKLNDLCIFLSRGKSPSYSDVPTNYPVFAQKCNLKDGGISLEQARFLKPETVSKWQEEYHLRTDDVLVNSTGTGTVCRTRLFNENCLGNYPFTVPDSHVSVVRTSNDICSAYIFYLFNSKIYQDYWEDRLAGSTNQKELYIGVLQDTPIPLPPLAEQKRIVAKIEEVFAEIDKLKK